MRIDASSRGWVTLSALVIVAAPVAAHGQAIGHVTAGAAAAQSIGNHNIAWQLGGGGEVLTGGASVGGEVDYIYLPEVSKTFDGGRGHSTSPAVSAFALGVTGRLFIGRDDPDRRVWPFVSGGFSFLTAREAPPLLNVGGGADWWKTERTGFRFEVRAQVPAMVAFRAGLVFK